LQSLETTNGRLAEDIAIERSQGKTNISLGEAQFYSALLELFGELFEIIAGGRLLLAGFCYF